MRTRFRNIQLYISIGAARTCDTYIHSQPDINNTKTEENDNNLKVPTKFIKIIIGLWSEKCDLVYDFVSITMDYCS